MRARWKPARHNRWAPCRYRRLSSLSLFRLVNSQPGARRWAGWSTFKYNLKLSRFVGGSRVPRGC